MTLKEIVIIAHGVQTQEEKYLVTTVSKTYQSISDKKNWTSASLCQTIIVKETQSTPFSRALDRCRTRPENPHCIDYQNTTIIQAADEDQRQDDVGTTPFLGEYVRDNGKQPTSVPNSPISGQEQLRCGRLDKCSELGRSLRPNNGDEETISSQTVPVPHISESGTGKRIRAPMLGQEEESQMGDLKQHHGGMDSRRSPPTKLRRVESALGKKIRIRPTKVD